MNTIQKLAKVLAILNHTLPFGGRNTEQVVEPKIAKLREAESELKVATKEKNAAEERMAKVQAKLDEMQAQFDAAMAQKQVRCPLQEVQGGRVVQCCVMGAWDPATNMQLVTFLNTPPCPLDNLAAGT
jgi:FKBP-type peptidyl-prolyl cis-trans isomerase